MKRNILTGVILLAFCACNKDNVIPADGHVAYINMYNAAEALIQNPQLNEGNTFFINDSLPGSLVPSAKAPIFGLSAPSGAHGGDFPELSGGEWGQAFDNIAPPADGRYSLIYWMPVKAENYRLIYTSMNKVYLKDTVANLDRNSFNTFYLVESPESDTAYRIISVPIERKSVAGKVRIQLVNVSPDIGSLEVYRSDENGANITENFPAALQFGEKSNYIDVDTAGSHKTFNSIVLKFRKKGDVDPLFTAAIPAITHSSFSLVFQGFTRQTDRKIRITNTAYRSVSVAPNINVIIRRIN